MLKSEFEEILGSKVSDEEYKVIEHVYTWHPAISNVNGEKQISDIYRAGGILAIKSMDDWACIMEELDRKYQETLKPVHQMKERIERAGSGDFSLEKCIKDFTEYREAGMDVPKIMQQLKTKYDDITILSAQKVLCPDKEAKCINLKALYDSGYRQLHFGAEIYKHDNMEIYELWTKRGDCRDVYLLHDQEIVTIISHSAKHTLVKSVRGKVYLTAEESQIAFS